MGSNRWDIVIFAMGRFRTRPRGAAPLPRTGGNCAMAPASALVKPLACSNNSENISENCKRSAAALAWRISSAAWR
jgi:hypothetical protein